MPGLLRTPSPGDPQPADPPTHSPGPRRLVALRDTMTRAQQTMLVARRPPADHVELRLARVAQLAAMTRYEEALTSCRLPIPPQLRREARLLRRLLG